MIFDLLQLLGGFILSIGYIPQIKQIVRTKSAKDLNIKTFLLVLTGILCMEVYAINLVIHNAGLMFLITNSISLIIAIIMCILINIYKKL
jgi:MtN3 and saliva related transmembrane protein